jgi:hypothetical protein
MINIADDVMNEGVVMRAINASSNLTDGVILIGILFEQLQRYVDYSSINNLLNASKKYKVVKQVNCYWKLNRKYSMKYYNEDLFRWNFLSIDTNRQLSLNLALVEGSNSETYASNLRYINTIRDVNAICNIHSLDLTGCCLLIDVGPLCNGHSLNLSRCSNVIDVTALRNIYDLNLSGCFKVADVQALGNVHTLNLSSCPLITDVSTLGRVHVRSIFLQKFDRYKRALECKILKFKILYLSP